MASLAEWIEGARPRTLPAAIAPVLAGTAVAIHTGGADALRAVLAGVVALALQVGVNYANDYSDGIRGTDADRVGPMRLVGSGAAAPGTVRNAAFASFGVAALAGLVLVVLTGAWWLLGVGVACILAAWYYTGGSRPYGYAGLGEVFVFVFFGLVATVGTTYVQTLTMPPAAWVAAVFAGCVASDVMLTNNLRDRAGDAVAGKHTLAVRLGDAGTRRLFAALAVVAALAIVGTAVLTTGWVALGVLGLAPLVGAVRRVLSGAEGRELIAALKSTGQAEFLAGALMLVGALVGR